VEQPLDLLLPAMPSLKLGGLPALVDDPAGDPVGGVLLTHGAGGDMKGAGLTALAHGLAANGFLVCRFDLPYRAEGRRSPPAAEKSVDGVVSAFEGAVERFGTSRWVVGGKSYGGRVASLAVAGGLDAAGLLFYGYPLHPPGKKESLRVGHWPEIRVPCLFLQGTHDSFCDSGLLNRHLPELGAEHELIVVDGGDHSLKVPAGRSPDGRARSEKLVIDGLVEPVVDWLKRVCGDSSRS